uniref:(northern house mosquito) hypothetical protein n=1 Tax=Culex pipiens TaxID=7175 RepID=A0A8D8DVJ5_CULPI
MDGLQRSRHAAPARLRRRRLRAQLLPHGALPPDDRLARVHPRRRRRQLPGHQPVDAGPVFPRPAPPNDPQLPQTAGRRRAQDAAPAVRVRVVARRPGPGNVLPAGARRSPRGGPQKGQTGCAVQRQALLQSERRTRCVRKGRCGPGSG